MKQCRYIIWMMLLVCFAACQDDVIEGTNYNSGDPISLVVGKTRAEVVNGEQLNDTVFSGGTRFHLFGTDGNDSWAVNLMRAQAAETENNKSTVVPAVAAENAENVTVYEPDPLDQNNKIPVTYKASELKDVVTGDIELTKVFRTPLFSVYGVTVVDPRADDAGFDETAEIIEANNALLEKYRTAGTVTSDGIPVYQVAYADDHSELPDVMWSGTLTGLTPKNHAGKIVMPFKHTLSRLNFKAMILNDEKNTNQLVDVAVNSLTLKDYADGALNMKNGLYSRILTADANGRYRNTLVNVSDFGNAPVVLNDKATEYIGSSLIFSTDGETYDAKTSKDNAALEAHCVTVDLVVTVGGTKKKFSDIPLGTNLPDGYEYMAFYPNMEYDITFTITTNAVVVTLTPQYYEYVPHDTNLDIFELGEPIDFGGVLWATHNLGATAADATASALAWEHARGFYYQYGRNIPYYARGSVLDPYPTEETHTITSGEVEWYQEKQQFLYTDATYGPEGKNVSVPYGNAKAYFNQYNHGARVYPYIPTLWERHSTSYLNFLENYIFYSAKQTTGQSVPSAPYTDPYHAASENIDPENFVFSNFCSPTKQWYPATTSITTNWDDESGEFGANPNTPAPKGWRLPTKEEYLSILPSSITVGDISFCGLIVRTNSRAPGPHWIRTDDEDETEKNVKESIARVYRHEIGTTTADITDVTDYKAQPAVYVGVYQDGNGYNDLSYNTTEKYREGWGSVYAIKCYGEDDAYALRWQIVIADSMEVRKNQVVPARSDVTSSSQWYLGRGVLVISKYDLGGDAKNAKLNYVATGIDYTKDLKSAEYTCHAFIDGTKGTVGAFDKEYDTEIVDWSRPSGKLYLPIPGYILCNSGGGEALIYPGCESVYWTASKNGEYGVSVRTKFAGDYNTRYVFVDDAEHVANGANIRCVRDVNASY